MNDEINISAKGSTIAHGNSSVINSNNSNSGNTFNETIIIKKAKRTAFWTSLVVGIISSLIATLIFEYLIRS